MKVDPSKALPPGIWYERSRNRFRVRVYSGRRAVHLSYHPTETDALETYLKVTEDRQHPGITALVAPTRKPANYLTTTEFCDKYFGARKAKKLSTRHRVYDWIHQGALPAVKLDDATFAIPAMEAYKFIRSLQTNAAGLRQVNV